MATKCKIDFLAFRLRGRIIKVDPDIYYKIRNTIHEEPYKMYRGNITALRISSDGYPQVICGSGPGSCIQLSRFVMGAKKGEIIDHRNRDPLDNRRKNLRVVTARQNSLNKKCKNTSGYIGVCIRRQRGRYYCLAQFRNSSGRQLSFRLPDSPENRIIAAFARDKFVLQGGEEEYAPLNFPCFKNEPFRSYLLEEDFKKYKKKSKQETTAVH